MGIYLGICMVALTITKKITKGRCGQIEYAIIIIVVCAFQVIISYKPGIIDDTILYLTGQYYYTRIPPDQYILLLLFCINIHVSTKRFNDAITNANDRYLVYISPLLNTVIYVGYYICFGGFYQLNEPRIPFLVLLILANIIPAVTLFSKESDIDIKSTDIPVNYKNFFSELYIDKNISVVSISDKYIYINNFIYSVSHYYDKHVITSYRDIGSEHLLTKYFMEKGIHRLVLHYKNVYYELTDKEYRDMIAAIKALDDVIYIDYPFVVVNNVNVFIRRYETRYCVVLSVSDKENFINESNMLKRISKKTENKQYICYHWIKKDDILRWIQKCMASRGLY